MKKRKLFGYQNSSGICASSLNLIFCFAIMVINVSCTTNKISVKNDQLKELKPGVTTIDQTIQIFGNPYRALQVDGNGDSSGITYTYETTDGTLLILFDDKTKKFVKYTKY